jgi:D-alanyl-D-alanine carboxypeptidase
MSIQTLLLSACVLCLSIGSCNKAENKSTETKRLEILAGVDSVRKVLEADNKIDVPSLNVLIETPTEKYFVSSVGKNGVAVTEETYYRFASVTKNFTATAILYQQQMGWLNIDDTITEMIPASSLSYVPNDPSWAFPFKNQITIKQLLQHSAGVYDIDNDNVPGYNDMSYTDFTLQNDPNHQFTITELVSVLKDKNLSYWEPGKDYHYSNTGYNILGEIVARVYSQHAGTTKLYSDFLKDKIYGAQSPVPLNLGFVWQATDMKLPEPYVKGMIISKDGIEIKDAVNASHHVAEGNGIGTMAGLNTYIRTLMKGKNVLTSETVTTMQNSKGPQAGNPYALGCSYFTNIGYGHNGASSGYLNLVAYDPKTDVSIVMMTPMWDLTDGMNSLVRCLKTLSEAGWVAREKLGYVGRP